MDPCLRVLRRWQNEVILVSPQQVAAQESQTRPIAGSKREKFELSTASSSRAKMPPWLLHLLGRIRAKSSMPRSCSQSPRQRTPGARRDVSPLSEPSCSLLPEV